jgi:hypothetical protein
VGWRQGHDPSPWFSTEAYLEENPDVAEADFVPLFHFLEFGVGEGRECKPSRYAEAYLTRDLATTQEENGAQATVQSEEYEYQKLVIRKEFDPDFYLALNPDVATSPTDPLSHFVEFGWREGVDVPGRKSGRRERRHQSILPLRSRRAK